MWEVGGVWEQCSAVGPLSTFASEDDGRLIKFSEFLLHRLKELSKRQRCGG